ncbi:MAG: PD-(D/E)XK nuclease family protein [Draconibacterium sp.]
MERFLAECAKYIYSKHERELQEICVVFPNRRAGVFFTSYLQNEISQPVIAPDVTTIGQLISENSEWQVAEKLHLISLLYDVFKKHTKTSETFDEFYFWGEILLADFNDIDRYLVNARDLFHNILDIKEIESVFDYLTPEQKKALEYFWGSVNHPNQNEFEKRHLAIWEKLYPVYTEFKEILKAKKIGYGGMIDRQVIESLKEDFPDFPFKKYYIVGLNALNACEKKFFSTLQKQKKIEFLWDYDKFYVEDYAQEAGRFMRENLKAFPPPFDFYFNNEVFGEKKNIKLVAVSSTYGQTQQIPLFIHEVKTSSTDNFDTTAIVLADESLLYPALGAIPGEVETVNVTMGYPVKNSVIYGFLMLLVSLLKNIRIDEKKGAIAYHRYVTDILNHQLLALWESEKTKYFLEQVQAKNRITVPLSEIDFTPVHQLIFTVPNAVENYSGYFLKILGTLYLKLKNDASEDKMLTEIIFSIYQNIEKLDSVVQEVAADEKREISSTVYFRLFGQYLGNVSVAFEGEPLSGIQVMGILETRCLDFKNLVILGLNENKWPRTFTAPSFIPHNIRKGFGLPGIDEQDAMYAYYFYRLIQRAENITATYSVLKEGISTGELSRYGYQLQYDSMHKPEKLNLDFHFANEPAQPILVKSSEDIVRQLLAKNSEEHQLSPSAINTYLQCSLRFYFRYVAGLPEPDEVKEEIDGVIFGNIFHDTVQALYQPFEGKVMNRSDIENIQKNKILIENEILKKIAKNYFNEKEENVSRVKLEGKSILVYENVKTYLNRLFVLDSEFAPFTLIGLERKFKMPLQITKNEKPLTIYVGGTIDRVDRKDGITRVLDYKTGFVKTLGFKSVEELFEKDQKDPKKEILQALIYSWILFGNENADEIYPVIYGLRNFFADSFDPSIKMNYKEVAFSELKEEFPGYLEKLVSEIYSVDNEFRQTPHLDHCTHCPYNEICQRFKP